MNILITGGSHGIGLGLKKALTHLGHDVYSWSRREGVDINDNNDIMDAIRRGLPPLNVIIHNAAKYHYEFGEDLKLRNYWFSKLFQTNVIAPDAIMVRLWARGLVAPSCKIMVVSTADLGDPPAWQAAYNCSKAALEALLHTWQNEHPGYQYYIWRPKVTNCGMWDPSRGPAEVTLEESVAECLSILSLTPMQQSKEKVTEPLVSPSS